jgi:hypothetical protein
LGLPYLKAPYPIELIGNAAIKELSHARYIRDQQDKIRMKTSAGYYTSDLRIKETLQTVYYREINSSDIWVSMAVSAAFKPK